MIAASGHSQKSRMINRCEDCKHKNLNGNQEPCKTCLAEGDRSPYQKLPKWEPEEDQCHEK